MISINMFRAAAFIALFICPTKATTSWCGMPDEGDPNIRLFLTCTCGELKCYYAWAMLTYDWDPSTWFTHLIIDACSKCASICNTVAKIGHDIHNRKNRANEAARRCLLKKIDTCRSIVKTVRKLKDHKNPANGAILRCLTKKF